ncbi:MAG TPA: hypothetical protein VJ652_12490 [Noviherbaspirillum sp.]|nr:hypothetical protein [Noviherbaspirillum sp.]
MTACARILALDQIMPGMTLSDALLDAQGNTLLPQGATVTEGVLHALRRRGIETVPVWIEAAAEPPGEAQTGVERERMRQRIAALFRRCGADGANGIALNYVTWHRIGKNA